jgi:FtsP/CotA-like multicopper oxidase with cupredoxin domain
MSNTADQDTPTPSRSSRRDFLRVSALGLAVPALAACNTGEVDTQAPKAVAGAGGVTHADSNHSGGTTASHPKTPAEVRAAADEMDRMHEEGIKQFPAKTAKMGNQLMQPRMEGNVKVYEVTARKIQWETKPGNMVEAFAYNDQVPGPQIRVREGDRVRFIVKNELEQSTAVHFHGLELPNDQDGVPFITQPPVKPGDSYTYEFTVPEGNSGSHMYHSHHNAAEQVGKGLLGARAPSRRWTWTT